MSHSIFFNYFAKQAEILQKYFELSVQQNSSVDLGTNREIFINEFINKTLPQKIHLTSGEVIDHEGNITGQLDAILIRNDTPTLDFGGKNIYLAGGVFAVIEIKSFLDIHKLSEAYKTLSKVSTLKIPNSTIFIGYDWPHGINIFKIIFAYSGNNLNSIERSLSAKKWDNAIDIICVLDKGILLKENILKELSVDYKEFQSFEDSSYVAINSSAASIAFLYSIITQFGNTFLGGRETIEPYLVNSEDTWNNPN